MIALVQRFRRRPGDPSDSAPPVGLGSGGMREEQELLRAMAVAGFAAGNLLLLSVAAWIGQSQNMGPVTRDLLHWVGALIAVPAILYAGQPFFTSALKALGRGRANSDLSISLAVGLAAGLGLFGNLQGAPNSGFDAAVILLFFLLIARRFEARARNQIPSAAKQLLDGLGLDNQSEAAKAIALAAQREARPVRLAEGIIRFTPPSVLALTLAAFLAWGQFIDASWGASWQEALLVALSVLIVAGPCTLLSAIPAAQIIASARLMRRGILLKSASALARLAKVDTLVFDKTGGLTCGQPVLLRNSLGEASDIGEEDLQVAASLAASSRHPLAAALRLAAPQVAPIEGVTETPGCGLSAPTRGGEIGLGSRQWCDIADDDRPGLEAWLTRPGRAPLRFRFDDPLRGDAKAVIHAIKALDCTTLLLSGDRPATVKSVARALGIETWAADYLPEEKSQRLQGLASQGQKILMVGDNLDGATPEPAAALVAIAPLSASEIRESGADAVIQGEQLEPLLELLIVARRVNRVAQQTFVLWFGYNAVALPLALLGLITPLNAASALSAVSILAIGNALRLSGRTS